MKDYIELSIKSLVDILLKDQLMTKDEVAEVLGIIPLQVYNYEIEKTLTPRPNVAWHIWNNVQVNGKQVLIKDYVTPDILERKYKRWLENQKSKPKY